MIQNGHVLFLEPANMLPYIVKGLLKIGLSEGSGDGEIIRGYLVGPV